MAKPGAARVRLLVVSHSVALCQDLTEPLAAYAPEVCPSSSGGVILAKCTKTPFRGEVGGGHHG